MTSQYGNKPMYAFLRDASMDSISYSEQKINPSGEKTSKKSSLSDREYMSAVERGDMEAAQAMVDEAAKASEKSERKGDESSEKSHSNKVKYMLPDKAKYDPETAGIKDQIRNAGELLDKMDVVFSGNVPNRFDSKSQAKVWANNELKRYGYRVDRQGFCVIEFAQKDIYGAIEHLTSAEEIVAIVAVPRVIKRGIQIGEHGNHKLREKHTVTFAAPVVLNGIRGNMAVVVNMKNKKYYVHRIIMPDGSAFKFAENKNTDQEMYQGVPKRSLADTTRSVSNNSIPDSGEKKQ